MSLAAKSQTLVLLTQVDSKKDFWQTIIVNPDGKEILVKTPALRVHNFSEGLASIQTLDKKYGFISLDGELVIPAQFQAVGHFSSGLAWARADNNKVGFIDRSGTWVIAPEMDVVKSFDKISGMARVKKDDQWYYVNLSGEALMIESDAYFDFSEGLAQGEKGGLRGFFDNKGNWIVEPKFQDARKFENGFAQVKLANKWGLIDKSGNWVVEPKYDVMKDVETVE
nr:WG repeat-containing protein [uncultured Fluviicola sp.]